MKRPRKNINPGRLSKELMAFLYEQVVLRWELDLAQHTGFNIRQKEFQVFQQKNGITFEPLKNTVDFANRMKAPLPSGNWFVFCDTQGSQTKSLFKHLRNAAAHGRIRKTRTKLSLQSFNIEKKEVMKGEIEMEIFEPFVRALVGTAITKQPRAAAVVGRVRAA